MILPNEANLTVAQRLCEATQKNRQNADHDQQFEQRIARISAINVLFRNRFSTRRLASFSILIAPEFVFVFQGSTSKGVYKGTGWEDSQREVKVYRGTLGREELLPGKCELNRPSLVNDRIEKKLTSSQRGDFLERPLYGRQRRG